jgi:ABC-2 type transport system permease protein
MRNIWLVARRELSAIFVQPIAYIFTIAIIFITGLAFVDQLTRLAFQPGGPTDLRGVLGWFSTIYIIVAPAITMRLLSEEKQSGTLELLMTMPIRDGEIVLGKFLAALIFYLITLVLTLIYPVILLGLGNPDIGPMLSGYLGLALWGSGLMAIGLLASAITENQIVAFIVGFGFIFFLFLIVVPGQIFTDASPLIETITQELSYINHLDNFLQGLIVVKDVAYYLLITAVFLFAATRVLESHRWR